MKHRRNFLGRLLPGGLAVGFGGLSAGRYFLEGNGQEPAHGTTGQSGTQFKDQNWRQRNFLQEYYEAKLIHASRERKERLDKVRTRRDVLALVADVRRRVRTCYGILPEKTPLNARITGVLERKGYRMEKVLYESRPGYVVSANLYLPEATRMNGAGKNPAVLATCGHSANGKAYGMYQSFARHLARLGFVTLIYDPPAQGERYEYPAIEGEPVIRGGTYAHNHLGNLMSLTNQRFALWEAWDGIRGIDYLLTRPEVDPTRIGVTGNSGGGTQTSHITCLDARVTMAAPSCFVTTFLYNLRNELPTDAEQVVPSWIRAGLDMGDFVIAHLPRPTILIGQEQDFFDVTGLTETYTELKRLYTILGRPENIQIHVGPGAHGFHPDARTAMYRFFTRVAGASDFFVEPGEELEADEDLHAAPEGDITRVQENSTANIIASIARTQKASRELSPTGDIRSELVRLAGMDDYKPEDIPGFRRSLTAGSDTNDGVTGLLILAEPPSRCFLHIGPGADPDAFPADVDEVTILIPNESAAGEMADFPDEYINGDLCALDTRGKGVMRKKIAGDRGDHFFQYYGSDYMYANHGLMLDRPLAGRRALDILKSIDLLNSMGVGRIHLAGQGTGCIPVAIAAAITSIPKSVTMVNYLPSYHMLTQDERYQWPFSAMIPGILRHFDLPDMYKYIKSRTDLRLVDPWHSRSLRIH